MQLIFAKENREIFEMLMRGEKSVETRAATARYRGIKIGDTLSFACEGNSFEKVVIRTEIFPSVVMLLKKYRPEDINPKLKTVEEIISMYRSFPGYDAKIREHGILAIELK